MAGPDGARVGSGTTENQQVAVESLGQLLQAACGRGALDHLGSGTELGGRLFKPDPGLLGQVREGVCRQRWHQAAPDRLGNHTDQQQFRPQAIGQLSGECQRVPRAVAFIESDNDAFEHFSSLSFGLPPPPGRSAGCLNPSYQPGEKPADGQ